MLMANARGTCDPSIVDGSAEVSTERASDSAGSTWTLADIAHAGGAKWPDALAVADALEVLTYSELSRRTRSMAARLARAGVTRSARVAIWGTKSVDAVVAMLATSMVGATFVPIDPLTPEERLRFILNDVAPLAAFVVDEQVLASPIREALADQTILTPSSRGDSQDVDTLQPVNPAGESSCEPSGELAYILYTSGSTGKPKGVEIEHRSIEAFFLAHNARSCIGPGDRCLNTGPLHFDVFVLDLLLPLWCGAFVRMTPELPIPSLILRAIERDRITHLYAVGTVLSIITGDGSALDRHSIGSLRLLQTGAEVCNPRVVNEWLKRVPGLRFLNSYGPTEATVGCISYVKAESGLLGSGDVPIGTPHPGTIAVIVDPSTGNPVTEPQQKGELLLGGKQVMRGYHHRELEQRAAFRSLNGTRFYRTGDLASRGSDGQIYFHGRINQELKLRGYRIHPSEIISALRSCPQVADAVVGLVELGSGGPQLAAVVKAPPQISEHEFLDDIRQHITKLLPPYMLPTLLVRATEFPRMPNGKCDQGLTLKLVEAAP